jgi:hypothetical protein
MYAEAKGVTKSAGTAADIMWGQLLRRMGELGDTGVRYAVVLPESIKHHTLRVPVRVRQRLGVEVYSVDDDGTVRRIDEN